jgi:uncharacterized Zn-finger protein
MSGSDYPKFRNDRGVSEICIGGEGIQVHRRVAAAGPPAPLHQYVGEADTMLCPYCATRFRFDPRLRIPDVDLFGDGEGIVDLDAKIPDGALDLRVPQ